MLKKCEINFATKMKRVIVDYKKLTENILNLLIERYPDGYSDFDIITFKNVSGELIEAVEVRTEDTIYLVKLHVQLVQRMIDHQDDDEDDVFEEVSDKDDLDELDFDDADNDDSDDNRDDNDEDNRSSDE
jgi:hypothetical protein